ncbi:MAG: polysaccharide deacetylase family protein [Actinomycetota bacterium]|nr:polysaccharide deacetylase family protein [Actinomycetota bacterium]
MVLSAVLSVVLSAGALTACSPPSAQPPAVATASAAPTSLLPEGPATVPSSTAFPTESPSETGPSDLSPPPDATPLPVASGPLAPVLSSLPVQQRVVFLGIDDGYTRSDWLLDLERHRHLPFTMFLVGNAWAQDVPYWLSMQAAGATVQDHTITHPELTRYGPYRIRHEICGAADAQTRAFGTRPWLFRPPYGATNYSVRREAAACGMRAVVLWDVAVNDGVVQYGTSRRHLVPGDIVLMHFRPSMRADMTAFLDAVAAQGLSLGRLEDYLPPDPYASPFASDPAPAPVTTASSGASGEPTPAPSHTPHG